MTTAGKLRTIWLLCLHACPLFCCIKLWAATGGLVDRPCVWGGRGGEGWAMDVQSITAAYGGGEGEVVSEESALFEYSRSIIRTRAAQRLSGCRRRPEQLPPLGRHQCADQEEKKKDAWGLVRVLSFRGFRGSTYQREGGSGVWTPVAMEICITSYLNWKWELRK